MTKQKFLLLLFLSLSVNLIGQIAPSAVENIEYLMTFGREAEKSWGDDDHVQVHFFVIPKTETAPVYFRIFDPGIGGKFDTQNGPFNTQSSFTLYGGKGTHSIKAAREVNPVSGYDQGKIIKQRTFGKEPQYDNKWFTFGPVNPSEGEYSEDFGGYIFKIICKGLSGNDGNAYKYALSYKRDANIPVENGNIFTYEMSFRLKSNVLSTAHIYPFMADGIIAFKQVNFDADNDLNLRVTSVGRKLVPASGSGDGNWASSDYKVLPKEKNTTVDLQMIKKTTAANDMVVYVLNQYDEAIPLFSSPIGGKPKYLYKIKVNYAF